MLKINFIHKNSNDQFIILGHYDIYSKLSIMTSRRSTPFSTQILKPQTNEILQKAPLR